MDRVRWTSDLVAKIETHVTKGGAVFDYELYWTEKPDTCSSILIKRNLIDALKRLLKGLNFWSARRQMAEVWEGGNKDAEVREIFESFLDDELRSTLLLAEGNPLIVDDKDLRNILCNSKGHLRYALDRYDFLVSGLSWNARQFVRTDGEHLP